MKKLSFALVAIATTLALSACNNTTPEKQQAEVAEPITDSIGSSSIQAEEVATSEEATSPENANIEQKQVDDEDLKNIHTVNYVDESGTSYTVVFNTNKKPPIVSIIDAENSDEVYELVQTTAWAKGAEYENADGTMKFEFQRNTAKWTVEGNTIKMTEASAK